MHSIKRLLEYPFVISSKIPKCYCFNMAIDGFGLSRKSPSFKRFLFLTKHSQSPVLIWRIFTSKMKQHCVKWRTTQLTVGSDSTVDGWFIPAFGCLARDICYIQLLSRILKPSGCRILSIRGVHFQLVTHLCVLDLLWLHFCYFQRLDISIDGELDMQHFHTVTES